MPKPDKKLGSLTVVCGSMFAGKSEELIRRARRALYAKKKIQVFKPALDDRYDLEMVVAHMGARHEATPVVSVSDLCDKIDPKAELILIEEAQFFDPSLVALAVSLADQGKEVVIAGLDQDFRREPFGPMALFMTAADEVIKLRAICVKCGAIASHTQRLVNGSPARWDDEIVLIGAQEAYEARCRNCYEMKQPSKKKKK
ncbi:MAG: thymidine kinase [bacterium]